MCVYLYMCVCLSFLSSTNSPAFPGATNLQYVSGLTALLLACTLCWSPTWTQISAFCLSCEIGFISIQSIARSHDAFAGKPVQSQSLRRQIIWSVLKNVRGHNYRNLAFRICLRVQSVINRRPEPPAHWHCKHSVMELLLSLLANKQRYLVYLPLNVLANLLCWEPFFSMPWCLNSS